MVSTCSNKLLYTFYLIWLNIFNYKRIGCNKLNFVFHIIFLNTIPKPRYFAAPLAKLDVDFQGKFKQSLTLLQWVKSKYTLKYFVKNKTSYLSKQYCKLNFVWWKIFDFVLRLSGKFCPYFSPNKPVPYMVEFERKTLAA